MKKQNICLLLCNSRFSLVTQSVEYKKKIRVSQKCTFTIKNTLYRHSLNIPLYTIPNLSAEKRPVQNRSLESSTFKIGQRMWPRSQMFMVPRCPWCPGLPYVHLAEFPLNLCVAGWQTENLDQIQYVGTPRHKTIAQRNPSLRPSGGGSIP